VGENAQPAEFTVSVREIEQKTKLEFMPELPSAERERLETEKAGVW
jgi:DNA/RNA endonuclease G (NUC1)